MAADLTYWLMQKKKIYRKKSGYTFEFEIPDLPVTLASELNIAEEAAHNVRESLSSNISSGKDATGAQHIPDDKTIERRKHDMQPPRTTRGKQFGPLTKTTKTGKVKIVKQKNRWEERYRGTTGSKGGGISFVDSGLLASGLTVSIEGNSVFVTVPPNRAAAVNAMHKGQYGGGGNPPIPILHCMPQPLDATLRRNLDDAFKKGFSKLTRAAINAAAKGLGSLAVGMAAEQIYDDGSDNQSAEDNSSEMAGETL